ncbi:hypothetical protein [Halomonas caseinilytica]|nr:hypothetical protein [Halomonas caseinilytica]
MTFSPETDRGGPVVMPGGGPSTRLYDLEVEEGLHRDEADIPETTTR